MESKKTDIINAAIKLFGENGYDKTSINDIVKEAGVSKGLVYHYFENKETLFKKVYFHCVDTIVNNVANSDAYNEKDIFKLLIKISIVKADYMNKNPEITTFVIEGHKALNRPEFLCLKKHIDEKQQKMRELLYINIDTSMFREDISKKECIEFIDMVLQGYTNMMLAKYKENIDIFLTNPQHILDVFNNITDMIRNGVYK